MTRPSSDQGRRIKLDLSNFVGDGGSLRWMFVADSEVRLVSDLADKLRAEYSQLRAGDTLTLLLDGFLLPPWEPATILQSGDLVTVIRTRPAAQHQTRGTRDTDSKPSTHAKKLKKSTPAKAKPQASSSSSSSDSSEDEVQPSVNANTKQVVTGVKRGRESSSSSSSDSDSSPPVQKQKCSKPPQKSPSIQTVTATSKNNVQSSSDSDTDSEDEESPKTVSTITLNVANKGCRAGPNSVQKQNNVKNISKTKTKKCLMISSIF